MSTILKALKKLENQRRREGSPQPLPLPVTFTDHSPASVLQRFSRYKTLVFAGTGLLLGLFAMWGYSQWKASAPKPVAVLPKTQHILSTKKPTHQPEPEHITPSKTNSPQARVARQPDTHLVESQNSSIPPNESAIPPTPAVTPATPDVRPPQKTIPPPETKPIVEKPSLPQQVTPPEITADSTPPIADKPVSDNVEAVPVLPDGTLLLQAISWANQPQESITVINDNILHQGQQVDGYTVVNIQPDDVIVQKDGRQWKLIFRIR